MPEVIFASISAQVQVDVTNCVIQEIVNRKSQLAIIGTVFHGTFGASLGYAPKSNRRN